MLVQLNGQGPAAACVEGEPLAVRLQELPDSFRLKCGLVTPRRRSSVAVLATVDLGRNGQEHSSGQVPAQRGQLM